MGGSEGVSKGVRERERGGMGERARCDGKCGVPMHGLRDAPSTAFVELELASNLRRHQCH